jgi:tetratricopeptide (TPR) repeat protein
MKKILLVLCLLCTCAHASEELRTQISALYAQNEINKALELLTAIPDKTPQDYLLIGNILQDKGQNTEAVTMYKRAAIIDPEFYKAYYNTGVIYMLEDRPHLAVNEFRKVTEIAPDLAWAHYNLGCALFNIGETKKARSEFERAIALKNNVPDFHYNLAYTYKKLGNEKSAQKYLEFYNKLVD